MSADPNSSPVVDPVTGAASPAGKVVELVRTQRQLVLLVLTVIGVLGLALTGFSAGKAVGYFRSAEDKTKAKGELDLPKPEGADKLDTKLPVPYQADYILGAICFAMLAIGGLGLALNHWLTHPASDLPSQLTQARTTILMIGGILGLVLIFTGFTFFILWFNSVTEWVDRRDSAEAKFVLLPILVFLLGAGIAFVSTGPARAEERNNRLLRRLIYGSNLLISTFLVALLLVVLNVVIAIRLPNKLDTTASGLNSIVLSQQTKDYLLNLNRKVVVYALLGEDDDPVFQDTRRLLNACKEVNPTLFTVNELSQILDRSEILKLRSRFPQITDPPFGLLVTLEDDDKKARFIGYRALVKQEATPGGRGMKLTYEGEAKLVTELVTLGEGNDQPTIYFTQSARELAMDRPTDPMATVPEERTAYDLKPALEKSYLKVKPLKADPNPAAAMKIPDDASVLVVADPLATLSPPMVEAIREYMTKPRGEKKGRLLLMSGAHPSGTGGELMPSGLEPLLTEFGLSLRPQVVYAEPQTSPASVLLASTNPGLLRGSEPNPIALSFRRYAIPFSNCRAIDILPNPPPNGTRAEPLFLSSESRYTWREPEILKNPEQEWETMVKNQSPELFRRKEIRPREASQIMGAISSDESGGRVILFGTGELFTDEFGRAIRQPLQAELMAACCNYLVQRPPAANIAGKTYGQWLPPARATLSQVLFLPVGMVLMGILAIGAGVWVFRRK